MLPNDKIPGDAAHFHPSQLSRQQKQDSPDKCLPSVNIRLCHVRDSAQNQCVVTHLEGTHEVNCKISAVNQDSDLSHLFEIHKQHILTFRTLPGSELTRVTPAMVTK